MILTKQETATVLAALRLWQAMQMGRRGVTFGELDAIASNNGEIIPLAVKEIDGLCEKLNFAEAAFAPKARPNDTRACKGRNATATQAKRPLLTMVEAAEEAGISRRFLEQEVGRGHLRVVRLSNRIVRIRPADWDRYLETNFSSRPAAAAEGSA